MLFRVDIAVPAFKIATGEDVEENICRVFGKGNGFFDFHQFYPEASDNTRISDKKGL